MNVVQVARRFVVDDWGGTETVIIEISKQLLRMGHRIVYRLVIPWTRYRGMCDGV